MKGGPDYMSVLPKISVVMAINKDNSFLDKAIQSILDQTFKDFEFIIIANGCDDDLWLKLNDINDVRVVLHRLTLGGFAFALNYGISVSRGKYIARMDADDIAHCERLDKQYRFMQEHLDIDVLGTSCSFIDELDCIIVNREFKIFTENKAIRNCLPYRNPIVHASMLIKRELLLRVGGYKYGLMSEDHELFIRLSRDSTVNFANLDTVLYFYRRHSEQVTNIKSAYNSYYEISAFLFSEFLRSKNVKYILGMLRVHPVIRKIYYLVRHLK